MSMENKVFVAAAMVEILIPHANSLKAKRKILKSIVERIRNRFNVSISEIGYLDKWQRSALGISIISNNRQVIEKNFTAIERLIVDFPEIEILNIEIDWL